MENAEPESDEEAVPSAKRDAVPMTVLDGEGFVSAHRSDVRVHWQTGMHCEFKICGKAAWVGDARAVR